MASANFAAVDLGAESGRVVLGVVGDQSLDLHVQHRFWNGPVRTIDELHWDTLLLWSEMKKGVGMAGSAAGGQLRGVGIDTWGVDFGLLGRDDVLLGNPFNYRDARTNGILEKAFDIVSREQIFEQTGIQFMQFNTLFQLLSMRLSNSVLLEMAETLLTMPDLFNFWFTGRKCCEFSNATTTQAYNPREGNWAKPLIEQLGIPSKIFPEIVPSGTEIGPVRKDVAEEIGVEGLKIIAPAQHDTGSAVAAVPAARNSNWAYLSSGTWSLMGMEVDAPIITPESVRYNFTNEGGVNGTYRFLKNIMGLWLVQECRRTWQREGKEYDYGELADMAAKSPAFVSLVNPDDPSFLAPGDMPSRIRDFCRKTDQPAPEGPGPMIRCCLESLALTYRQTLSWLEECTGKKVDVLHIVGGGIQNRHLCEWTANATGRVVKAGPIEATAAGNIAVQAVATGVLPDIWAARDLVRRSFEMTDYQPSGTDEWSEAYDRFMKLRLA